ncbi:MAG: methylmalonyl-CoA mutase subunit beta [Flavobacteriaceae bacterium]
MKKSNLFDEFQDTSSKGWKQKIQSDLKGADYNSTLIFDTPEGIPIKPFYHRDESSGPLPKITSPSKWFIAQHIFGGNTSTANKKSADVLERGAESLIFTIPTQATEISKLLKGLSLQNTPIHFNFQFLSSDYLKGFMDVAGSSDNNLYFNLDPIGDLARSGKWHYTRKEDLNQLASLVKIQNAGSISVDTSLYQNAGANIVQQLAYGLAHANEYLNSLESHLRDGSIPDLFTFKMAIGGNYFFEIAKLRALRLLWNSLTDEYGIATPCHVVAQPSKRNKTLYDFNTNMLRTTMESMAAILGGANTVCNLPYDALYHKDNEFGERIARNQLLMLKHESHLDKVSNATEGAYFIEKITLQLAEKALGLFKNIEAGGGFIKQLEDGVIQKKIKENAQKEQQTFNDGKEVLVGTNVYQNSSDAMKSNLELYPFVKTEPRKTLIAPIIESRLSETLEQQRLNNE